jgi:hypothetical protein
MDRGNRAAGSFVLIAGVRIAGRKMISIPDYRSYNTNGNRIRNKAHCVLEGKFRFIADMVYTHPPHRCTGYTLSNRCSSLLQPAKRSGGMDSKDAGLPSFSFMDSIS